MLAKLMSLRVAQFMAAASGALLGVGSTIPSHAQAWPQQAVKFVLPLGPGSGTDVGARLLASPLAARWGKPVIVDNRPGGDSIIAISAFINANDDHTLLFAPSGSFVVHPYVRSNVPYDARELVPIARVSNTVVGIAVARSLNVSSLGELFAVARAQPGKLNWAPTSGLTDIVASSFLKKSGLDVVKVPYGNSVQGMQDLVEGRLHMYVTALAIVRSQADAGKIRIVAVTNRERSPIFPDVPTVAEAGFPALTLEGLVGLFGRRKMSGELRERIAADIRAVATDPAIAGRLAATGQVLNVGTPSEFSESIEEQRKRVVEAARSLGINLAE